MFTVTAAALAIGSIVGSCPGQSTTRTDDPPHPSPPAARPAPTTSPTAEADPGRRLRQPPLLREGSRLVEVTGRLRGDAATGAWVFVVESEDAAVGVPSLTVLPSTLLEEMERMIEAAADHQPIFEVTGEVYVYRHRNYLLLTHPAILLGHEIIFELRPEPEPAPSPATEEDDSIAAIIRDLERSIGPLPRRPPADTPPDAPPTGTPPPSAPTDGQAEPPRLMTEGAILLSRRGKIRRAGAGAFIFVFDADAEGLADPPMPLLPCLLLERLEMHARLTGERAAVLVSGNVHTFHGQNYLRPTLYQIPRGRTILRP